MQLTALRAAADCGVTPSAALRASVVGPVQRRNDFRSARRTDRNVLGHWARSRRVESPTLDYHPAKFIDNIRTCRRAFPDGDEMQRMTW